MHVRKLFIILRGNKWDRGNRNIKLVPREEYFEVLVNYTWDGPWIKAKALFPNYIPLLRELIYLCRRRDEGYGVRIMFRDGRYRTSRFGTTPTLFKTLLPAGA